jgi:hypothetical protein
MLDFDSLDAGLEAAVGFAPTALLQACAPTWADRFLLAREHLSELSEVSGATPEQQLERERLSSYFGCAYGDHGFLARMGALHTLSLKLRGLRDALPRLAAEAGALGQVRREVTLLRTLAQRRLSSPRHDDDLPLLHRLDVLHDSVGRLGDVARELSAAHRALQTATTGGRLYGLADITNVASDIREGLTLSGAISFVLGRLADHSYVVEARSLLDELAEAHQQELRDALWTLAEEGWDKRKSPPTLTELRELDLLLEQLRAELTSPQRAAQARVEALTGLYTVLAMAQAEAATDLATRLRDGTLLLLVEGIAVEARRK